MSAFVDFVMTALVLVIFAGISAFEFWGFMRDVKKGKYFEAGMWLAFLAFALSIIVSIGLAV